MMDTNASKLSVLEITTQAIALSYNERVELIGKLVESLRGQGRDNPSRDEKYWRELLNKYRGCMKGTWDGMDAVEYQRSLREDREIG